MTTDELQKADHETVLEWLPWYAEGTLDPDERILAERHLQHCSVCREELERNRQIGLLFASRPQDPDQTWQPSDAHFAEILARIETAEPTIEAAARPADSRRWLENMRAWLGGVPSGFRWLLAVETFALAALALVLVMPRLAPPEQSLYETYTDGEATAPAPGSRLHLVFAEDLTEAELRALLRSVQGQLAAGPSGLGVYTVVLRDGDSAQALRTLRAHPKVRLAEAVSAGQAP